MRKKFEYENSKDPSCLFWFKQLVVIVAPLPHLEQIRANLKLLLVFC